MATVRLRGPLKRPAGDRSDHALGGATVGEVLASLESAHPALDGWIMDERRSFGRDRITAAGRTL